jgi:bifunctional non-homologous end joining protein LigD
MAAPSTDPGSRGAGAPQSTRTVVDGHRLTLTNLEKVLYPDTGFTKAAVIDYYARIAPVMLAHLSRRALTMVRYPNGVRAESFFEKRCPSHAPSWVATARSDAGITACIVDDRATLVWVANLAALELHTHQATVDDPEHPSALVLDLDPGPPAGVLDCCRVALELRMVLDRLGLRSVVKTSGGKGLHLSVPVAGTTSEHTKDVAKSLAELLEGAAPDRVTSVMAKERRGGRVFIDWSQNDRHKTTVCAYSLRAQPFPSVSAPITWDEVDDALGADDADALTFDATEVLARVERHGDLYADSLAADQELPRLG